jgi:penicillin-binding protein-related factor A (putative recombinase)
MKKVVAHIIKQGGINKWIAIKNQQVKYLERWNIYKDIALMLHYKRTKEDIYYHHSWLLSMTKDFAQYQ